MACSLVLADDLDATGLSDSSDSPDSDESLYEEMVEEEGLQEMVLLPRSCTVRM